MMVVGSSCCSVSVALHPTRCLEGSVRPSVLLCLFFAHDVLLVCGGVCGVGGGGWGRGGHGSTGLAGWDGVGWEGMRWGGGVGG